METNQPETVCPLCRAPIAGTDNFCPKCGSKLKEAPIIISTKKQIFVYLFSFFLAPLGLGYAYKYLKQSDPKIRKIGIIVVVLTVLAVAIMIWTTSAFTQWELQTINTF